MKNKFLITGVLFTSYWCQAQNLFISYVSAQDTKVFEQYQLENQVSQTIVWEMSGDVDPVVNPTNSMFKAIKDANPLGNLMTYWTNWGIYTTARAITGTPYFIPGAIDVQNGGKVETNLDFDHKMQYIDSVGYSFLQIAKDGTIYFNDPWADLLLDDPWCQNGANLTCSYQYKSQGKPFAANFGNFEAFSKYNNGRNITKYLSIGGGSDLGNQSFAYLIGNQQTTQQFITTAMALLKQYNLNGLDLNYELYFNDAQALQYYQLIQAIDTAFQGTPYKLSISSAVGFAGSLWNYYTRISNLSTVSRINLETYEFWGATFGGGKTGLFENTYPVTVPEAAGTLSVDQFMQRLLLLKPQLSKIAFGLGDYGRAVGGIDVASGLLNPVSGLANTGLYANFLPDATVPAGNFDPYDCSTAMPAATLPQCSGVFTNNYIINNFNDSNFTVVDWTNNGKNLPNGTTAYTDSYTPPAQTNYSLTISNNSATIGITIKLIANGVASVGPLNYQAPKTSSTYNTYSNPSLAPIEGVTGLSVSYTTWQGTFICQSTLDLNQNRVINIDPAGSPTCVIV